MPESTFSRNLAFIEKRHPDLARQLRAMSDGKDAHAPSLQFEDTPQGVPTLKYHGALLASRHRPLDEAQRLVEPIDIARKATVVVLGFGLGYHLEALARRMLRTGIILVFEPDLQLLRAVIERHDISAWGERTNLAIATDPLDRAALSQLLKGAEGIITLGTTIIEHPASRKRLEGLSNQFSRTLAEVVAAMRTTMMTTLVHSTTTCRNLMLNIDHYAAGEGIAPLHNWAAGRTAILMAAGPTLSQHLTELADPMVRDRAVIITVQTCLKTLLAHSIRPHFVTALDYHEISKQFYEGVTPEDVADTTLVCEPKANRAIIENFPGKVRCTGSGFLDHILAPGLKREMGRVTAGSTVAHLSFYLAQYLGCDPIVFVGQDLGFTDGLYYGPGASIHEQWAPELNEFNTLEMMEWQRIMRMKCTLRTTTDVHGREILIDEQMATYLNQFERDFAEAPQTIIDAGGGGTRKAGTQVRRLSEVLAELNDAPPLPPLPPHRGALDQSRIHRTKSQLQELAGRVTRFAALSRDTTGIIDEMLVHQTDKPKMDQLFRRLNRNTSEVQRLKGVLDAINLINQLGIFKRLRADRNLELAQGLTPLERQKAQLERDKVNVEWLAEAADEFLAVLDEADRVLGGRSVDSRITQRLAENRIEAELKSHADGESTSASNTRRVAAFIAVDPEFDTLLTPRTLADTFGSMLRTSLKRLAKSTLLDAIVLFLPKGFNLEECIDCAQLEKQFGNPLHIRTVHDLEQWRTSRAVAVARHFSPDCWRGGIGGMTVYDELNHPALFAPAMDELGFDAALLVGPDWTQIDLSEITGVDAVIRRFREQPDQHRIVFSQSPPGLCPCLIARSLMHEMMCGARQFTIGSMLSYIPSLPQLDPVTKDVCIKVPAAIRNDLHRYTGDCSSSSAVTASDLPRKKSQPEIIEIELVGQPRVKNGAVDQTIDLQMSFDQIESLLTRIGQSFNPAFISLTFGGLSDPLAHPDFASLLRFASEQVGFRSIHLRTNLVCQRDTALALMNLPIDILSVNLAADTAATYQRLTGSDRFATVIANLEAIINERSRRSGDANTIALPWIVPRIPRLAETVGEIRNFYDRWLHLIGAAVIDGPAAWRGLPLKIDPRENDSFIQLAPLPQIIRREERRTLVILHDGSVPLRLDARTWDGRQPSADDCRLQSDTHSCDLADLWQQLLQKRQASDESLPCDDHDELTRQTNHEPVAAFN